ncbi:hypothetical protein AMAG_18184 [Allomyces macrogynus ATCC 38327]|uniref:C2H2-type domain-containing protein n=1 Tax=Allomyces macrogynus (strain ATCC 38327) TaxID=578462 RepID=A0A0L0SAI0_ALLM3|nr:hypothetical protein AMAG_18184 [Allomyces macrogynus ATCC 38327]|eukprot:KNE59471.1 hypothetical protein AMAG_18184 [Allomyces macrogynus ATCC 38327]
MLPVDGDATGPASMLAGRDPPADSSCSAQDAHWPGIGGLYAPHTAAILGKWTWFQYLVAQGVSPRPSPASTPALLWRPLGAPAKTPWAEVIDQGDEDGWTLLMYAVLADCVEARDWPVGEGSEPAPLRFTSFFYETRPAQFRAQAACAAPQTPLWVAVALDSIPVLTAIAAHPILPSVLASLPRDAARRADLIRHLFRTARSLTALRLLSESLFPDPRTRCANLFDADTLGASPWLNRASCTFPGCTFTASHDIAYEHFKQVHGESAAHPNGDGQFPCPFPSCTRVLTARATCLRHFAWHFPRTFQCAVCHTWCRTPQSLATHVWEKHEKTTE